MFNPAVSDDLKLMLASSLAVGSTAGVAGANIVTVLDPANTIISNTTFSVSVFSSTLTLAPNTYYGNLNFTPDSINMTFTNGYYGAFGSIQSNHVAANTPGPVSSPSLLHNGAQSLNLLGTTVDGAGAWEQPVSFVYYGTTEWNTAELRTDTGDFNFLAYANGDSIYVGYASSDLSNFGYLQAQRVNATTYKLVGYRYGTAGEGILVQDLTIPAPSALATLAVAGLVSGRRKRRTS